MNSKKDPFVHAVAALVESTSNRDISKILSIIKAGTEDKSKRNEKCIFKFVERNGALKHLITLLPNDEDNTNSILSILADLCTLSYAACEAVISFGVLKHVGKILKSRRHDDIIINSCLRLVANFCNFHKHFTNIVVKDKSNLNIIESIVRILYLILEEDVPSKTTLILLLSTLCNIFNMHMSLTSIEKDYGIVKALGCMMIKFIDDWKTSKKNHDSLAIAMKLLELCSQFNYRNISYELKNTGRGDAMLLMSDLIVMPAVSWTIKNILLNLLRRYTHYSDVPFDDIFAKVIEKLRDSNAYTNKTEDKEYDIFLNILCELLTPEILTENLIATVTVSLLNALQSYVQPTEVSLINCAMLINTLQQDQLKCCLRPMLEGGILTILSSKLDCIFGVENQLDLYHESLPIPVSSYTMHKYDSNQDETRLLRQYHEMVFESQFYDNLDTSHTEFNAIEARRARDYIRSFSSGASTPSMSDQMEDNELFYMLAYSSYLKDKLSTVRNEPKRAKYMKRFDHSTWWYENLFSEILNLIECFADLKPAAVELGTSDIVYKLLLFLLPKNELIHPHYIMKIIKNIIKKPENLVNLLTQTQFVCTANKLFIPIHNSSCVRCIDLFTVGYMIMEELTKVVEDTIDKGDIAHSLYTASPTIKQTLVVALPFFAKKMSALHTFMITCGGLDVLIEAFRLENPQRGFVICGLKELAHKIHIKDPNGCSYTSNFSNNNDDVATVLKIENYQPRAGRTVTFIFDDDSCVQANRKLLASKSDFFNQLLFGQFMEAHLEVVRLPETPQQPFELVLMLLQLDDIAIDDKVCRNGGKLLEHVDLAIVLEAIVLCDRFLLRELYTSLTLFVQHWKFSPTTVPIMYRWLVDLPAHILRTEIIAYSLIGYMSEEQRNCLFEELLKSENSERFVDDMKTMFRRFLCAS